MKSRDNTVPIG